MLETATKLKLIILSAAIAGSSACALEADAPEPPDQLESAVEPDECVGAEGFEPPRYTLEDVQATFGFVAYFTDPMHPERLAELFTGPWTNWYRETDQRKALAKLATMRGILDRFNLYDMYLGALPPVACPPGAAEARQADGTCNNLDRPLEGAAGVRIGRNIPPLLPSQNPDGSTTYVKNPAANPDLANLMSPNPREVSRKLFKRTTFKEVPFLNNLATAWVQFMVHDWFSHGENSTTRYHQVPLADDDELRVKYGVSELVIPFSADDPTRTNPTENALLPPSFQNEVTHWWDGSQIYGSDLATANRLRSFEGGRLLMDAQGLLPVAADGFEDTGMRRNWWVGLSLMHNLFSREHNAIADMLRAAYPAATDQWLYDKARLINAAVMAKIHTVEWTPAILPNQTLTIGMHSNWEGLNRYLDIGLPFKPRELRNSTTDPIIYGVAGGNRDDKGVPFTMTEEFVSVYRMHPLLPDLITIKAAATGKTLDTVPTASTRNAGARALQEQYGVDNLLYSFGTTKPGALVLDNYPRFLQDLNIPFMGPLDMGTIDILRDRERGIPRYNDFREQLRLKRVASFEELTGGNRVLARRLRMVYGDIDKVDALVGTFAEATRPSCYGFGETLFQVFTLMATRRLQADRFFTNDFRPEIYTPEGMAWIEAVTMKGVLLRHHPELAGTGLAEVANPFFPWE
jgi:hypothetical protein